MYYWLATHLFFILSNAGCSLGLHAQPVPSARRLEYIGPVFGHKMGILDRIQAFCLLAGLGKFHNASVHLLHFGKGPQAYLTTEHSPTVNDSWEHYLEPLPFDGVISKKPDCVTFADENIDFFHVFDGGVTCVKLAMPFYGQVINMKRLFDMRVEFQPSHVVLSTADRIEQQYDLKNAGAIHIRRCDVLDQNRFCTDPSAIAGSLQGLPDITSWVVFWYAEVGYKDRLKRSLVQPGRTILFEDEMPLNPFNDGDNYFQFMVSQELCRRSEVTVDTRRCFDRKSPWVVERPRPGIRLEYRGAAAMDEQLSATCREPTSSG